MRDDKAMCFLEFGSAMQELPSSKQYNPGRVPNFSLKFRAIVRNKPSAKFLVQKIPGAKIPPPLVY